MTSSSTTAAISNGSDHEGETMSDDGSGDDAATSAVTFEVDGPVVVITMSAARWRR